VTKLNFSCFMVQSFVAGETARCISICLATACGGSKVLVKSNSDGCATSDFNSQALW